MGVNEKMSRDEDFDEDEDSLDGKFLTFVLGAENFGIEIRHVIEIIGMQKIIEIPDMPDYVRGMINLRDKVIPVMDMRARFRLPSKDDDEQTCIIVVCIEESSIGLIVDKVNEVADIPEDRIEPPPNVSGRRSGAFIQGMAKMDPMVVILLDAEELLRSEDLVNLDIAWEEAGAQEI